MEVYVFESYDYSVQSFSGRLKNYKEVINRNAISSKKLAYAVYETYVSYKNKIYRVSKTRLGKNYICLDQRDVLSDSMIRF